MSLLTIIKLCGISMEKPNASVGGTCAFKSPIHHLLRVKHHRHAIPESTRSVISHTEVITT